VEQRISALEIRLHDADTVFLRLERTPVTRVFKATMWSSAGPIGSWTTELEQQAAIAHDVPEAGDLQEAGRLLFTSAFPSEIGARIGTMLQSRLRLVIDVSSGDDAISRLPWEALAPHTATPGLEGRLHVIRYLQAKDDTSTGAGDDVIRMLAVIPSLKDLGVIGEGEARQVLEMALTAARDRGTLRYSVLTGEVTRAKLHDSMKEQRPHIFHFFGHAGVDLPSEEGGIYLGSGHAEYVGAGSVARFFTNTGEAARLAVLLGAETGSGREKGVQNSVAGRLILAGVPAVIGTLRPVTVHSALLFSRRFYSALFEDGDVERALAEARKALAREKWDWAAYGLFSSETAVTRLPLRLPPTT
jgi:hypothetical protein